MRTLRNGIIAIAAVGLIALGVNAFAHGGMGWGGGWGAQRGYRSDYGPQMSQQQYEQFEQQRESFLKDTQDLRSSLYDKQRQLQNELAKEEPDAAAASRLQKEISDLQSKIDQKRVDHMVQMRKIDPDFGRGYGRGYYGRDGHMMGYGGGHMMGYGGYGGGPMMGYGGGYGGGGYCW